MIRQDTIRKTTSPIRVREVRVGTEVVGISRRRTRVSGDVSPLKQNLISI